MVKIFLPLGFLLLLFSFSAKGQKSNTISATEKLYLAAVKKNQYAEAAQHALTLGKLYSDNNKPEKAIQAFTQSLSNAKKAKQNGAIYVALQSLGAAYFEQKDYNKALSNFQESQKIAQKMNNTALEAESLINIGRCYGAMNKQKKAVEPLEQAMLLAINRHDVDLQMRSTSLLADYHNTLGNRKQAIEFRNQYDLLVQQKEATAYNKKQINKLKAQISTVESKRKEAEIQASEQSQKLKEAEELSLTRQMELELMSKDLDLLHKQNELLAKQKELLSKEKELAEVKVMEQTARIRNEMLVRNAVIVVSLLVGVLVLVVIIDYRKKIRANQKIKQQNETITSSINYAKRIQEAMLPKNDHQHYFADNSFILFKPRDVVSGDFYWFAPIRNGHTNGAYDIAFAAVDCTGHGVPGALMSMIGMNALNSIVSRGISNSHHILENLHHEIRTALKQENTGNNDGMDLSLCIYRKEKGVLEFSGAKNKLIYIQDNELKHIKGDIHPIGGSKSKPVLNFNRHEITINKPTMVYLFSDGYQDQFGGSNNSKFMSKRFYELLHQIHHLPLHEQHDKLHQAFEQWKADTRQTDDVLVIGIRIA
jgi:serine phosphatase RsbU (regulator of sigma subunit)